MRRRYSGYCEEGTDRADCGLPPLDPTVNCPAIGTDPYEPLEEGDKHPRVFKVLQTLDFAFSFAAFSTVILECAALER